MSFVVVWNPRPIAAIDAAWDIASPAEQGKIEEAIGVLHRVLSDDPSTAGESRQTLDTRFFYSAPVAAYYRIDRRLQQVRVYAAVIYGGAR
ncbi:hypothetical protein Pla108_37160 [Botrimarina colliarenosi]|uniref:Plasmid stabilization system protein n=1 Tax=Botrimarina colliarenosi TaxID=2528001 RepID=A0A5C6A664_9BACT|nr:hypothetical protein [Botrimarina colliarenosi]TWT94865.1 hypothetical protein Pla108_37160 [Botrimarina colliarenosi]